MRKRLEEIARRWAPSAVPAYHRDRGGCLGEQDVEWLVEELKRAALALGLAEREGFMLGPNEARIVSEVHRQRDLNSGCNARRHDGT